jgi:glycosyltransferase involved in cell wall biosynthesis
MAIPAYSEEQFIAQVVHQVLQYVKAVLVIDDGSPDRTASNAEAAGAMVVRHSTNLGKGAALKTGLSYGTAGGARFFLFLDGDGQHDQQWGKQNCEQIIAWAAPPEIGPRVRGKPRPCREFDVRWSVGWRGLE